MGNWVIETFVSTLRSKVSASGNQHSKPTQPKQTLRIRTLKLPDAPAADAGKNATTTPPPPPKEKSSGSEVVNTSNPDAQKEGVERRKKLIAERIANLARFGPTYGQDTEANMKVKDSAWKQITGVEGKGNEIKKYLDLIKGMEKEVVDCYDDTIFDQKLKRGKEFRMVIARDGCFFLQLALHILGGGGHLGYQDQNPYFGKGIDSTSWIPDMFFVGNQIPYIVIKALMEQPFFQDVIKKGVENNTWQRPVNDLAKLALYLTVVEPHLEKKKKPNRFLVFIGVQQPPPDASEEPSSDILLTLHNLVLKSRSDTDDPTYHEMREFEDLEANNEGKAKDMKIPSAGELRKRGIKLVKGEPGISNIRFTNWVYSAYLYVPPFTVDAHSEKLLTSLANHELALNESERELTAYLRFMRDLSRTYKDFTILRKKGIICVEDEKLKRTMVKMLDTIVSQHNSNYTLNFRQIRRKVKDYGGPPWRFISVCLGILAIVQTIFTVLAYVMPLT